MKLKPFICGLISYLPGLNRLHSRKTGGTNSARYCYSVWLRHLVHARQNCLNTCPGVIAELGPGDSLGMGLAGLISGSEQYYAFDVVESACDNTNKQIFDELVTLFQKREAIPGESEFPSVKPTLNDYTFPYDILDDQRLTIALEPSRIDKIRESIDNHRHIDSVVKYKVPWFDSQILEPESVDMIFSQAVLEHVEDLKNTYQAMHKWLKPSGYISNQIDFKSHGTAEEWNGHWTYRDLIWKIIRGNRPYLLNREPHSTHIKLLAEEGFKIVCDKESKAKSIYKRQQLAPRFRSISEEDLETAGVFLQAVKS